MTWTRMAGLTRFYRDAADLGLAPGFREIQGRELVRDGKRVLSHDGEKKLPVRDIGQAGLLGAVSGLAELKRPMRVHLYTVSDYLKDGATTWVEGWRRKGWTTRDGKPVSHRDLWQKLEALGRRHRIEWHVLEGSDLPQEMEYAKQLAKEALKSPD